MLDDINKDEIHFFLTDIKPCEYCALFLPDDKSKKLVCSIPYQRKCEAVIKIYRLYKMISPEDV